MVPPGNVVVVMDSGGLTVRVKFLLAGGSTAVSTVIETLKLSVIVFVVPLIVPVMAAIESPGGKPEAVHVRGPVPPEACTVKEYAEPLTASGKAVVVIVSACACPACASDRASTSAVSTRKAGFHLSTLRPRLGTLIGVERPRLLVRK